MLKWIAQNKYKLMAIITGMYLLVDVLQHKGQARVLFPKEFPGSPYQVLPVQSMNDITGGSKNWIKGVNTKEQMSKLDVDIAGFECDVYFDSTTKTFEVHHDPGRGSNYRLEDLFMQYQQKKMQAGIWLDIKNLDEGNAASCLSTLIKIRNDVNLQNRILIESGHARLLNVFCDSGFFTVYYVPFFNPYQVNDDQAKGFADSIASQLGQSKIYALSGYYFQSSFLKNYFPRYPVLTWIDNKPFSLVNYLFQRKINADTSIFIALKP